MKTTDQQSVDNLLLREGGYPHLPESNSMNEKKCNCKTWARVPTDKLPMSDHAKGCALYKEEHFVKVSFEGNYLIVEPQDADEYIEEGMVREDVLMTRDQFERLPEFEGF